MPATAGAPAWILVVTGVLNVLYSVAYGLWTLMPLFWSFSVYGSSLISGDVDLGTAIAGILLTGTIPLLQLVGFFVTFVMSCITILGGLRLNQYRSKGVVWLGILCAVGAPVLSLLINAGSALNLGSLGMGCLTGCLLGNVPTLILLVISLGAALGGVLTVTGGPAAARFAGRG